MVITVPKFGLGFPLYTNASLRELETFSEETILWELVLHPYWKGSTLKRKEFVPSGNKFFPFRVDPFSEGVWYAQNQPGVTKVVKNDGNIYQSNPVTLIEALRIYNEAKTLYERNASAQISLFTCAGWPCDHVTHSTLTLITTFTERHTSCTCCAGMNEISITKTCLYNFDSLKPHFYIVKLGLQGYTLFFLFLLKT